MPKTVDLSEDEPLRLVIRRATSVGRLTALPAVWTPAEPDASWRAAEHTRMMGAPAAAATAPR